MSAHWWHRDPAETEQEWANRIEEHNPSERDELWAANARHRENKRAALDSDTPRHAQN